MRAASKVAFGDVNCLARGPEVFAGERRKIVGGTGQENAQRSLSFRAGDASSIESPSPRVERGEGDTERSGVRVRGGA